MEVPYVYLGTGILAREGSRKKLPSPPTDSVDIAKSILIQRYLKVC